MVYLWSICVMVVVMVMMVMMVLMVIVESMVIINFVYGRDGRRDGRDSRRDGRDSRRDGRVCLLSWSSCYHGSHHFVYYHSRVIIPFYRLP